VADWRSVEDLTQWGFTHAPVVMANEGHSGPARCIRTREIGVRIIRAAHIAGARRLAMEALPWPSESSQGPIRAIPPRARGYLAAGHAQIDRGCTRSGMEPSTATSGWRTTSSQTPTPLLRPNPRRGDNRWSAVISEFWHGARRGIGKLVFWDNSSLFRVGKQAGSARPAGFRGACVLRPKRPGRFTA
jgi:hypothetical protein